MITNTVASTPVRALLTSWAALARQQDYSTGRHSLRDLKVFVDCEEWLEDEVKPEIDFVQYVYNQGDADVCMTVTPDSSHGTTRHYNVRFAGRGRFALIEASARLHLPKRRLDGFRRFYSVDSETATA
jgi:hypothetical protein